MGQQTEKTDEPIRVGQLNRTIGFLVRRLHNSLVARWYDDIGGAAQRVTPVQAGLLILIAENPGVTQARLLKVLDIESATLVKSITRLVEYDYIVKKRDPSDKRAFHLFLTPTGTEVHAKVTARMRERDKRLAEEIDPAEYEVFRKVLTQLIRTRSQNGSPF